MTPTAYWISPRGEVIDTHDERHINYVWSNPEQFKLTQKDIAAVYKKYKERIGQEGKAREEIMIDLMKQGWLRARFTNNNGWIIQSYLLNKRDRDNIWDFIRQLFEEKKVRKHDTVMITAIRGGSDVETYSAEEVLKGDLYGEKQLVREKEKIREAMKMFRKSMRLAEMIKIKK